MTATANPETTLKEGRVVAIAGPVVDVEFPPDALPEINTALEMDIELEGETADLSAQVVDARPADRFAGKAPEPRPGLRSGHMPRSFNVPYARLVENGQLVSAARIQLR